MEKTSLIKKEEGLRLKAYQCSAGVWTIGYGTTVYPDGKKVKQGDICTKAQADQYLWDYVEKHIKLPSCRVYKETAEAALCSLIYNIGQDAFDSSTLKKMIDLNEDKEKISKAWMMWNKVRDPKTHKLKVSDGLDNRRKRELTLFFA